ncbi:MAG: hypothetical protein O8C61_06300 [Candidatus Methanoperedens sp.]|nr:hypothetical protein [Candidatus Methanoperedens sp.]
MKQQDAYKILAAFLVITMLGSVFAYIFIGKNPDTTQTTDTSATNLDKYNPEFWTVNQPFYSISDALKMTPPGAIVTYFVDLENMPPEMIQWVRQALPVIQEVDSLYKSNTTIMYYASIKEGNNNSFLLLSTMFPMKNDFEYIVIPNTNNILQRQDTGMINIMGTPVIYAPDQTASEVLNIIYGLNKSVTSYDQYENLLTKVEPAPYQIINANVSFAKQFYIGLNFVNGSYEGTTAYLDANSSVLKKINQSKANSTQNGFEQFSINQSRNYTIVKVVSPELLNVISEFNEETN